MFGHEDRFLNHIGTASTILPIIPMTKYGQTKCQPVHSTDIGVAVNRIINVSLKSRYCCGKNVLMQTNLLTKLAIFLIGT